MIPAMIYVVAMVILYLISWRLERKALRRFAWVQVTEASLALTAALMELALAIDGVRDMIVEAWRERMAREVTS